MKQQSYFFVNVIIIKTFVGLPIELLKITSIFKEYFNSIFCKNLHKKWSGVCTNLLIENQGALNQSLDWSSHSVNGWAQFRCDNALQYHTFLSNSFSSCWWVAKWPVTYHLPVNLLVCQHSLSLMVWGLSILEGYQKCNSYIMIAPTHMTLPWACWL